MKEFDNLIFQFGTSSWVEQEEKSALFNLQNKTLRSEIIIAFDFCNYMPIIAFDFLQN
jgi:hypothetical protein